MAGINKVILVGNLGAEPEIRSTADGKQVAKLSLATSQSWKDKTTGEQKEKTEWHKVVLFGGLAGVAEMYLHKGAKVYIEGKLRTNKWQDNNGNDRYTTEVVVSGIGTTMQMLDGRDGGTNEYTGDSQIHSNTPNIGGGYGNDDDPVPF